MGKRGIFAILVFSTIVSLAFFLIIFFFVNPFTANWLLVLVFYIDIIILATSVLAITFLYFRIKFSEGKTNFLPISVSIRQAFLVSIAVVGILLLKAGRILNIWDAALLILAVILIEFYYKK